MCWLGAAKPMSDEILPIAAADSTKGTPMYQRWSPEKANQWYNSRSWMVGCNYIPSTASNQLEMWQAQTFDPQRIDVELRWAQSLGFNSVRVFLHDLVWEEDAAGYVERIDNFLCIASKHHIDTLFVIFDSCWNPAPHLGPQDPPLYGLHNSRWVQSPGSEAWVDSHSYPRLQAYVTSLIASFRDDPRIIGWDLWNEPDNDNASSYPELEAANKLAIVNRLVPKVFDWARAAQPTQPLTSAVWFGDWAPSCLTPIQRTQLERSDVISFHNYENLEKLRKRIPLLRPHGRPLLCTEYMARTFESTFQNILPFLKSEKIAAFNWGFVDGKTQTRFPWTSWQVPPREGHEGGWFHDILHSDGRPYREDEVETIRQLTKGLSRPTHHTSKARPPVNPTVESPVATSPHNPR